MNWNEIHNTGSVEEMLDYFHKDMQKNPQRVKIEVEGELETMYVRMGNDHDGRGIVGENSLVATTAALEAVRAHCMKLIKEAE